MKPVVLTFVGGYLPGYRGGGPIRTIANMVESLGDEFDFRIVTMDRDLGDRHAYDNVRVDEWNIVGKAQVYYAGPAMRSLRSIARLLRETPHDLLYLNGYFNPIFTLRPIVVRRFFRGRKCPIIVAPRGEFAKSALKIKRWKKFPFIRLARLLGLFNEVVWHASTDAEADDIRREQHVERKKIKVASNIATKTNFLGSHEQKLAHSCNDVVLRVCFLSRIAPMKNLTYALGVLAQVKVPVQFSIYGPQESPKYWDECQALIDRLPPHVNATYLGSVEPFQVRSVIAAHDVFFVPTRGENFGHVFLESFSAGVPVLVSDKTPWRNLKAKDLGWDISLDDPGEFAKALDLFSSFDEARRELMKKACTQFALERTQSEEVLEMNRRLFLDSLRSGASQVN